MKESVLPYMLLWCARKRHPKGPSLGGFGALPPVNAYAPGMRRPTQNGLSQKPKTIKANKAKKE